MGLPVSGLPVDEAELDEISDLQEKADADITDWMRWHWGQSSQGWPYPHGDQ